MKDRKNQLFGYNDSIFSRFSVETAKNLFGNDDFHRYIPITMKMLLHDAIMLSLSRANLLSGVVFHGGTCLQRIYDWSRLSEDLDFANIEKLDENRFFDFGRRFSEAIVSELHPLGFPDDHITIREPKNMVFPGQNEPEVRRWSIRVNVGNRNMKQMVNIELANMPSYDYAPTNFRPLAETMYATPVMVNVEPLNVIFNDKLMAVIQRNHLKYRDIYDVGLLSDTQSVDSDIFMRKMADRQFSEDHVIDKIGETIQKLSNLATVEEFKAEMRRFFMPGRTCDIENDSICEEIIGKAIESLHCAEETARAAMGSEFGTK